MQVMQQLSTSHGAQFKPVVQEDFYLLDLVGGASQTALHPTRPIVAYNSVHHQHEVFAIAFSPPGAGSSQSGGDFLISVDFDRNDISDPNSPSSSTIILWNWQKGQCLQEIQIPKSQNNQSYLYQPGPMQSISYLSRNIQIAFERVGGMFVVLESGQYGASDQGSGYRGTLWNLNRQQRIEMLSQMELELQNEKQAIKIWEYQNGHADLLKRIQIKQNMRQCLVAELTGYLLILGDNGKILILDQEGEFISTIKRDLTFFTTINTAHDKLLLGTDRGTICVYHLASLQFISEIPYQLGVLSNFQLNSSPYIDKQNKEEPSVFQLGPPVQQVATTLNMRFLFIKYQDQSFVIIDRTVPNPNQSILGYQYGHFQKVTGLQWMRPSLTSGSKKHKFPIYGENLSLHQQANASFVTCSQDMSIFVWKHFGDRWSFSYIDVVKGCFDQSLTYQRKLNEKSTQNLELTSIRVYPRSPLVAVGDNKGIVRIFQVTQEKALFIGSHQLVKGNEQHSLADDQIKDIYITLDELYAIISFQSGLICCYDVKNSYNLIGIIEKDAQRFCYSNQLEVRMKVLESETHSMSYFSPNRAQDEKPIYLNTSFEQDYISPASGAFSSSFRILSTTSPNFDEGKISGFDVHPSNDYLLVTSNQGRVYMFRIDTGELRGTIRTPLHAKECLIDPSGLYLIIQVPPFSPKHTSNLLGEVNDFNSNLSTHERDLERTTLLMFEVGTGRACAELKSLFEVTQLSFSPDGRYLSLGSRTGAVCVWALGEHLIQNVKQVLDLVKVQPDFWANYPIFLEDYGTYGMIQTIPSQQFPTLENRQIDRPEDYDNNIHHMSPNQINRGSGSDGFLSSQRQNPLSTLKSGSRTNIGQQIQTHQDHGLQKQSFIRPPMRQDQQIQSNIQYTQSERKYQPTNQFDQNQRQIQKDMAQQQQQNKFYRKTFMEDQQTQMTPHIRMQLARGQLRYKLAPHFQNMEIQPMFIKTSKNKESQVQLNKITIHSLRSMGNTGYQRHLPHQLLPQVQNLKQEPDISKSGGSAYKRGGQVEYIPRQDFIDRTQQNQNAPGYLQPLVAQRNVFQEENPMQQRDQPLRYEENLDAADLYNPFQNNQAQNALVNLYATGNTVPISSIQHSPLRLNASYGGQNNIGGRLQPISSDEKRQVIRDPLDIDDDISDNGPESLENQLKELDGMNKYLQNIRVPTRFANDEFLTVNGRNGEQAYTLERLRQEERLISMDPPDHIIEEISNSAGAGGSTYDLVEEMYENMDQFDQKIKSKYSTRQGMY
ncbi:UNKNOWN [Stylonychia lemnae]|uniref:Uncharacterized protein n=1 Tax=Stylonychia lemnae TaxID=5949 RepID=A0A078AGS7_STYLE|nr:UNKNOWN [Stylonychia lemnae]|eukprot:CDW81046.1 UNKNOWN [Stylonychia lemnae]